MRGGWRKLIGRLLCDAPAVQQPDAKKQRTDDMSATATAAASAAAKYTLYSYFRSGASYRVRIAMQHKQIPYKYVPISLVKDEQSGAEYSKLNPQHKVPLLTWEEAGQQRSLSQSVAIIDYLEQAHPETPALVPKDLCQHT